jgi:hypothetical protein
MHKQIFKTHDSKGKFEFVFTEEKGGDDCGPLSLVMTEILYKHCHQNPEKHIYALSQKIPGGWHHDPNDPLAHLQSMAVLLEDDGVRAKALQRDGSAVASTIQHYVGERTPIILLVAWNSGFFHWIVCRRVYPDNTVIFLDPIHKVVEMPLANLPAYQPSPTSSGVFNGKMVVTSLPPLHPKAKHKK